MKVLVEVICIYLALIYEQHWLHKGKVDVKSSTIAIAMVAMNFNPESYIC